MKIIKKLKKLIRKPIDALENSFMCSLVMLRGVKLGKNVLIRGRVHIYSEGEIYISDNVTVNSRFSANPIGTQTFTSLLTKENATLRVGKGSGMSNCTICCYKNIEIGEDVFIGGDSKIYDSDFHSVRYEKRILRSKDDDVKIRDVIIGDGVFIGAGSIILKGSQIGSKSVIGAGSVVSGKIPANQIWAGNPARFIKKID